MPEYLVMTLVNEAEEGRLAPAEAKALVEGQSAYERKLRVAGAYLDGERLRPSAEGKRVGLRGGEPYVEDGPFDEASLGGYTLLKADSLDAAVTLAEEQPLSPGAELDVRPLMKGTVRSGKTDQQGRVFAFVVLGKAPNERAWIDVMDRIDDSTRDDFPADRVLGGLRLHAPGRGRRVVATGNQRAVFDGPFLESKEVIGGVFFMRMASVREAVGWASRSAFARIGAVEIRELWRS
jgi:hypothetical protein